MYQLIETIRIENGNLCNISFHDTRLNRARKQLFNCHYEISLAKNIVVPYQFMKGIFKCRVTYNSEIRKIEFEPYSVRQISSLQLVNGDHIEYSYKYADRTELEQLFKLRGECDDILIVKNGCITDSYYANIVLSKGGELFTPANPLLAGTRREYYIQKGIIQTALITPENLKDFSNARIINAMISLEESPVIDIDNIKW